MQKRFENRSHSTQVVSEEMCLGGIKKSPADVICNVTKPEGRMKVSRSFSIFIKLFD